MTAPALTPKLGDRSLFPELRSLAYLNHAAISPVSEPVRRAVQRALDDLAQEGSLKFPERLAERQRLREQLAQLMNARSSREIAFVPSTLYGLAVLATSLPWRKRMRVIVFEGEYPTNVSVWQRACAQHDLSLCMLPVSDFARADGPDLSALERELSRGDVQLCAVSAVQFQSGLRMPLARIAQLCHAHGAQLAVDAVQALGSLPFDVQAFDVDYAAAGSHKWLMGIDGAGVLYVRQEHLSQLSPAFAGAFSHVDAELIFSAAGELRYDRPLRDEARVFEGGMLSSVGISALAASVPLLLALDPARIHAHVNSYLDALEAGLCERGFRSLRAPDSERRSCTLAVLPPSAAGLSASRIATQLAAQRIVCSGPDGALRFAPHFANELREVSGVLTAIDEVMRSAR